MPLPPRSHTRPGRAPIPLTSRPIAGRHVEQGLIEPVTVELLGNHFGWVLVRGEMLDPLEAAASGDGEAVEKPDFLKASIATSGLAATLSPRAD